MKKFFLLLGAVLFINVIQAQVQQGGQDQNPDNQKKETPTITKDENTREHVCSATCKAGKHTYAHGERGHKCGAACMKEMSKESGKAHVCSAACKAGKHSYAHGERGHTCSDACKKAATGNKG
jgi:hypothetical protein